jgi:large repetitive protein
VKRFGLLVALATVLAATVVVGGGSAASFDDTGPCPTIGPFFTCPTGTVGQQYSVQLKGKQGCDDYWFEVLSGSLPAGLSMSRGGLISGVPTASGRSDFYVQIHDVTAAEGGPSWCGYDDRSQKQFVINIAAGLSITSESLPAGTVGQPYSQTLSAAVGGSPASASWTLRSGALPPGMTLSASGALSGTPTADGSFQVDVTAQAGAASDTKSFTIVIRQPIAITQPDEHWAGAHGAEVGISIDAHLNATGGTGTYAWSLDAGSLPSGVALGADGTISGTPALAGDYAFTIKASDSEGRTATLDGTVTIAPRLALRTLKLKAARVGHAYSAALRTLGGATPLKFKLLGGKLPRGIHFGKKLGVFVGKPIRQGRYRVLVQVVDAYGVEAQKAFVLVVEA